MKNSQGPQEIPQAPAPGLALGLEYIHRIYLLLSQYRYSMFKIGEEVKALYKICHSLLLLYFCEVKYQGNVQCVIRCLVLPS